MQKRHYLESAASFFVVGLGQILKGEGEKGLKLLLAFYFVLPAVVYLSMTISGYLFLTSLSFSLFLGLILWGYSFCDALLN